MVDSSDPPPQTYLGSAKPAGFIGRLALVLFIVTTVAALFAYAGGWLTPHALTPARMVDTFEQVNGVHPGFRRNHAKGVGFSGKFQSNGQGASISKASVFQPGGFPVIGRFALAIGQPFQADAPHTVRSMAIRIKLPDGQEWRSGMNNIPVFAVSTPQAFYELIQAGAPDHKTGKPDPEKMSAFLARNPESSTAIALIRSHPFSLSDRDGRTDPSPANSPRQSSALCGIADDSHNPRLPAAPDIPGSPQRGALSHVGPSGRPASPHVGVEDTIKVRLETS